VRRFDVAFLPSFPRKESGVKSPQSKAPLNDLARITFMSAAWQIKLIVLVWLIVVLAVASIAGKEKPPKSDDQQRIEPNRSAHAEESKSDLWSRLREGSKIIDEIGEFQITADRINFYLQGEKRAIRVLENLSLERVARTLEDDPAPRLWNVSGTVTEFRGENYLLITRAVLKPRAVPAARTLNNKKAPAHEAETPAK
jgi:hypothetical protein